MSLTQLNNVSLYLKESDIYFIPSHFIEESCGTDGSYFYQYWRHNVDKKERYT